MNEEGTKVLERPILVLTCFYAIQDYIFLRSKLLLLYYLLALSKNSLVRAKQRKLVIYKNNYLVLF